MKNVYPPTWEINVDNFEYINERSTPYWEKIKESDIIEKEYQEYLKNTSNKEYQIESKIFNFEKNLVYEKDKPSILIKIRREENRIDYESSLDKYYKEQTEFISSSIILNINEKKINYIFLDLLFILTTEFTRLNNDSKSDLKEFSRRYIEDKNLNKIDFDKFCSELKEESIDPIYWYTKPCFVYKMINNTMRKTDYTDIFLLRHFINILSKKLKKLSLDGNVNVSSGKLYRGTIIKKIELDEMKKNISKPFILKGFISTSKDEEVAHDFRKRLIKEDYESVLFIFQFKEKDKERICDISELSYFKKEKEHLININTFLVLEKIKECKDEDENNYYEILVRFSDFEEFKKKFDKELLNYKDSIKTIFKKSYNYDRFYLADIFAHLSKPKEIIKLFENFECNNQKDLALMYEFIGGSYEKLDEFKKALEVEKKALEIRKKEFGEDSSYTANMYHMVGNTYESMKDYKSAIEYYNKALNIWKNLKDKSPDIFRSIATSLNNLGYLYQNQGENEKALDYHNEALQIRKEKIGDDQPDYAMSLNNIGKTLQNLGKHSQALGNLFKALEIYKKTLGENHPRTSFCFENLGTTYICLEIYEEALKYLEKCFSIRKDNLGLNNNYTTRIYEMIQKIKP